MENIIFEIVAIISTLMYLHASAVIYKVMFLFDFYQYNNQFTEISYKKWRQSIWFLCKTNLSK